MLEVTRAVLGCRHADELTAMNAPRRIMEAAAEVQKYLDAKMRPPASLVGLIEAWVYRPQNRYGR